MVAPLCCYHHSRSGCATVSLLLWLQLSHGHMVIVAVAVVTPSCHCHCHSCIIFAVISAIVVRPQLKKAKCFGAKVPYLVMVIRSDCLEFGLCNLCPSLSHVTFMACFPFSLLAEQHTAGLSLNLSHHCPTSGTPMPTPCAVSWSSPSTFLANLH